MTCSNCGSPLDQGAAFCGNCGRQISAAPVTPPLPPAPAANVAYAVSTPPAAPQKKDGKATASMVLGIVSLIAWLIPLIGIPVTVMALVFGIRHRHAANHGQAVAGIVMGCISIPLILFSIYIGVTAALNK
jgi:heme/copper-type cytochrome/quinol oxidase subunit 2